jgi:hypothetical protein
MVTGQTLRVRRPWGHWGRWNRLTGGGDEGLGLGWRADAGVVVMAVVGTWRENIRHWALVECWCWHWAGRKVGRQGVGGDDWHLAGEDPALGIGERCCGRLAGGQVGRPGLECYRHRAGECPAGRAGAGQLAVGWVRSGRQGGRRAGKGKAARRRG